MNTALTPGDWEFLSAYLDGQLTEAEQRRVQDLMARRDDWRLGYEELRRTRAVLRAAPRRRAPRNFTLTPAMARQAKPAFRWGWAPSFRLASALATFLFMLSFFFRLSPAGLPVSTVPMAAPAPMAAQADRTMLEKGQTENAGDPPIIIWNDSGRGSAPAGAGGGMGGGPTVGPAGKAVLGTENMETPEVTPPATTFAGPTPTPQVKSAAAPATQTTTDNAAQENLASNTASGPILGVAPTGEQGQVVGDAYSRTVQAAQSEPALPYAASPQAQDLAIWSWVQAGLAGIALLSGLAAILLWWRSRH